MKLFTLLCFCLLLKGEISADPLGFSSLDCGYNGLAYTDSSTGLTWTSDNTTAFNPAANTLETNYLSVDPPPSDSSQYFRSVRYFTGNRTKYCYVFDASNSGVAQGSAYLIRASFWAGNYATAPPSGVKRINASRIFFQIYINADYWDDVLIDRFPQVSPLVKEIYMVSNYSSEISVCLGGPAVPGSDSSFISALELRLLSSQMSAVGTMVNTSRYLFTLHRINFGASSTTPLRYSKDKFDRIWEANTDQRSLSTNKTVYSGLYDSPPLEVLQTARTTAVGETQFNATLGIRGSSLIKGSGYRDYFYDLYMAEISELENVTLAGQRVFDISVYDGVSYYSSANGYDILKYTKNQSFTATGWYSGKSGFLSADGYRQGSLIFTFSQSNGSLFGPQINGLELLLASQTKPSAGTLLSDVNTIQAMLKDSFQGALQSWRGDPCLPYSYNWIGCSKDVNPTIISLSLANQNLTGGIPSYIADLTSLITLDLQGNRLSGNIPEFLATLQNLKILLLQNNNFSGAIPTKLLEKQSSGKLQINVDLNPLLCKSTCVPPVSSPTSSTPTQRKNNMKFIIIGIIIAIFVIVLIIICLLALSYYAGRKKRQENNNKTNVEVQLVGNTQLHIATSNKPRAFSYVEVDAITNKFSVVLGKGGFGTVFYGLLENTLHVAIKVLSYSSTQGIEEFLNEVNLLSRAHHRNLVGLVGYCIETQVMLIYEYMPNGSLESIIHGDSSSNYNLSWKERLKILVDVAQGIDYLHNGCQPKIIHRDLKPANILINQNMEAKISDFGISRMSYDYKGDFSNTVTSVKGSTAYMAPEYINHGKIDEKIDVYAFGIVLLEVISGRSPFRDLPNGKMQHIKHWVKPLFEAGKLMEIIDPNMSFQDSNVSSMWKVLEIAIACIDEYSTSRPTMEEIVGELKNTLLMELEVDFNTNSHPTTAEWKIDSLLR